jgi:diacylglycerol kinase family enzyme
MNGQENFAVMLNANARRVTADVRRKVERIVAPENIYYSHSIEESGEIAQRIAEQDYRTVFTGGGDGTFVKFVNDYADMSRPLTAVNPNIGVLHLGTGNAVASIVSSGNFECDLQSYVNTGHNDVQPLELVQAEGARFPFGGLGLDAEVLNDYMDIKGGIGANPLLKPVFQNLGGYFAAFFGKTMPRRLKNALARERTEVRVINLGSEAYSLRGGETVKAYGRGEVLYEGPSTTTMFGTLPTYGHGMTVLPYSMTRPGHFHLRTARMSAMKALANLPSIWKGKYVGDDMLDWHAKHVRLEFSKPVPYQYGGDAQGYRDSVEIEISPVSVNLLRFI